MKKRIQLLALTIVGCVIMSSCTVVDALKNFWDFHQNFQPNKENSEEESTTQGTEEEVITEEQAEEREVFEAFLDNMFLEYLEKDAFTIHFTLQYPEKYGITFDEEDYVLANYEQIDYEAEWEKYEASIVKLKQIDKDLLTTQQQIMYDKIVYNLEFDEKYAEITDYGSYIGGANGIVFSLASSFYEYKFLEKDDVEDYLKFLKDIPNYIDYVIEKTQLQIMEGLIPSKYMLKINIENIDLICFDENNIFLDGFKQKMEEAVFLTEEEKEYLLEENEKIVEKYVNSAFSTLRSAMTDWYEKEEEYEGLYSLEDGQYYYEYLVEYYTGSDMSVNEMYRYLTKKLENYENAFYTLIQSNMRVYNMLVNGNYGFTLTEPQDILDKLIEYTVKSFPTIKDPGYTISWLPESLESQGLLAYYVTPQVDTEVTNVIRLNSANLDNDLAQLYTTLAHEGYPGHLYATNYIQQQNWHPLNELFTYMGYTEGWAEYVGLRSLYYWDDISKSVADAVIYNQEMGYILQAITDIGINYKGWTLKDMCEVWSNYYEIEDESELRDIYDYFKAEPATILSYPMGYLQIMDLRSSVKDILGTSFSDMEFAKAFLDIGGAPFSIVEDYVLDWATDKVNMVNNVDKKLTTEQ